MGFRCQVWGFSTKFRPKLKTARYRFLFFAGLEWRTYRRFSTFTSATFMARCLRSQSLLCKVRLWIYTRSLHWILHEAAFYFANCNETNCARFPAGALLLFRFLRIPAFMWTFFLRKRGNPYSKCCENAFHISNSGRHSWGFVSFLQTPMRFHLTTWILNFRWYLHKFSLMSWRRSSFKQASIESLDAIPSQLGEGKLVEGKLVEGKLYCVTNLVWTMHSINKRSHYQSVLVIPRPRLNSRQWHFP